LKTNNQIRINTVGGYNVLVKAKTAVISLAAAVAAFNVYVSLCPTEITNQALFSAFDLFVATPRFGLNVLFGRKRLARLTKKALFNDFARELLLGPTDKSPTSTPNIFPALLKLIVCECVRERECVCGGNQKANGTCKVLP